MATLLNADDEMILRMETDLLDKSQAAFQNAGVMGRIFGVYSLDDLEEINENQLATKLAVGVGYAGAEPASDGRVQQGKGPGGKNVFVIDFTFHVVLAVPHGPGCKERHSGTQLLTVLRRGINGTSCDGDATNRVWAFMKEFPNSAESTDTVLYYSQIWSLRLMTVSTS